MESAGIDMPDFWIQSCIQGNLLTQIPNKTAVIQHNIP